MHRTNWLTAGVTMANIVVTMASDCCSTFSVGWPLPTPAPTAFSALRTSSSTASGWLID